MTIDIRITAVSNGFVAVKPRPKVEIEDAIVRYDLVSVFANVDEVCAWIKEQAKAGPNV